MRARRLGAALRARLGGPAPMRAARMSTGPTRIPLPDELLSSIRVGEGERRELLATLPPQRIRNFSIVAHVDHGKSTLADRLLEAVGNIAADHRPQVLDSLPVERQRGITVKAQTASLFYRSVAGVPHLLNLIDTPGHVDFSYEVSRSLAACEGALLLVDVSQGVQAQTLANFQLAQQAKLDIVPVLSKIDISHTEPDAVLEQMFQALEVDPDSVVRCSAKSGQGIGELLEAVIERVRPPAVSQGDEARPFRALLFDMWFDEHRGVVCLVQVRTGQLRVGDPIGTYHAQGVYEVQEVGLLLPSATPVEALRAGQVGYVIAGIKTPQEVRLGETLFALEKRTPAAFSKAQPTVEPFPGFKPAKSMVFAGLYPTAMSDFEELKTAMEKLVLTDASVSMRRESSDALGMGFRCGFLGVLHMAVFCQRLQQEFDAPVIATAPTVTYKVRLRDEEEARLIESPSKFPDPVDIVESFEPVVNASVVCPDEYIGSIMELFTAHRCSNMEMQHITSGRCVLKCLLPLAEIVTDFYDKIKSLSSGYASFDYEDAGFRAIDLVKVEIKINGRAVDALAVLSPRESAEYVGRRTCERVRDSLARQQFEVAIQAMIASKVIARERLAPYRKDVLTKGGKTVGGGDRTRKMKLLEKQREGKRRLKEKGSLAVDANSIVALFTKDEDD